MADDPTTVKFEYLKSNLFRIIHVDGAYGGVTPRLGLFVSFYSERPPIPRVLVHQLKEGGGLGDEIKEKRESREGIIREAEVGVLMDADVAKSLVTWLQQKIDQIESIKTEIEKPKREALTEPNNIPENIH
jgi:hypothetical protein